MRNLAAGPRTSVRSAGGRLILDAALEVFSERGYAGTTMQSVADAAGVTKPVVYDSFANRDELLLALLAREEQHLVLSIVAALPADPSVGTPEEHVLEGLTAFLETAARSPHSWRIVFGAQYGAAPVVADRVRAARAFLVEGLRLTLVQSLPGSHRRRTRTCRCWPRCSPR